MSPLQIIVLILFVAWLCGFGFSVGGSLIHAILVIAIVLFIFDLLGRRGSGTG